jgi:hypothetical protein
MAHPPGVALVWTSIYTCSYPGIIISAERKSHVPQRDFSVERLRRHFERLARQLGRTRWVLVGTIRPRRIPARHGASRKLLGPYYQWTFKERGKTVTVNLSATQREAFQRAIDQQRQLEELLGRMRALSRQFLEATTQGVRRRKLTP